MEKKQLFTETKGKNKFFSERQFLVNMAFSDAVGGIPGEIHILPKGKWDHPVYGEMEITDKDIELFMKHFNDGLRRDIPITEGHAQDGEEKPAVGWFKKLINRENGLWAVVDWTKQGLDLLAQKAYKYFSPEFYQTYEDPESREVFDCVLVGGALTNKPYFKELTPVMLSENNINYFEEKKPMDIKELMKKKASDLTKEEKEFLKACDKSKMSEQEKKFAEEAEVAPAEEPKTEEPKTEEPKAEEPKTEEPKVEEPKVEEPKTPEEPVTASEKNIVKISAGELKALQDKADEGAKAFAELKKQKITNAVEALLFSEKNSKGKFLPKGKDKLVAFMESLTDKQLVAFQEVMGSVPSVKLFGEIGVEDAQVSEGTAKERVFAETEKLMKEDSKLKFSDAVKVVGKKNPALMKEYEAEIAAK